MCDRAMCEGNLLTIVLHVSVVRQDCRRGWKSTSDRPWKRLVPLSTRIAQTCLSNPLPSAFTCTHTINGSRRKKIGGGFLGVVTEGPKRMSRDRSDLHTVSRGKGWFRVEIVEIRLNGYAIVSRIINIVIWNFTNNNINIIRLG